MRSFVVVAALLVSSVARADDPPAPLDPYAAPDDPGSPGENATPAPPDDAQPPAQPKRPRVKDPSGPASTPERKARMMTVPPTRGPQLRVKDDGDSRLEKKEDEVAGGKHWRIKTAQGAVHVWVPPDYDRETAGTVIYVHGYWTDADGAWRDHELARQFKKSHQNAMFIVPDAPASNDDSVQWPALKDLRRAVTRANIHLPDGPVIVMGHSGAFRTVMQWVDHRLVEQIILLDAMYAGESAFDEYIGSGKRADEHKLIVVAANTAQESAAFARKYKFAVARETMPDTVGGFSHREKTAKLLYIRSQYEHMSIVTSGKVIPVLLHLTPLKAL